MKGVILNIFFLMSLMSFSQAQEIEKEKAIGGYRYLQDGNLLSMNDLVETLKPHPVAHDLMVKAKSSNIWATVFATAGGALVGWPVGSAIGGREPNWAIAGFGFGLIGICIPFASSANRKAEEAVGLYNSSLGANTFNERNTEFNFVFKGNGVGVTINF